MTHEERKAAIADALSNFLIVYTPPRSVAGDEGQAEMMGRYVDALVNKVPLGRADEFKAMLERCFRFVADAHEGWAWPSIAEFSKAASRLHGVGGEKRAQESFSVDDPMDAMTERMKRGAAVPEGQLWGLMASNAVASGRIGRELLESYRMACISLYRQTYKNGADKMLVDKFGSAVLPYVGAVH